MHPSLRFEADAETKAAAAGYFQCPAAVVYLEVLTSLALARHIGREPAVQVLGVGRAPCCLVQFQSPVMAHARVTVRYALAAAAAAAAPSFADVGVVVWVGVVGVDVARVVASVGERVAAEKRSPRELDEEASVGSAVVGVAAVIILAAAAAAAAAAAGVAGVAAAAGVAGELLGAGAGPGVHAASDDPGDSSSRLFVAVLQPALGQQLSVPAAPPVLAAVPESLAGAAVVGAAVA